MVGKWKVDHNEKLIYVPHTEENEAKQNESVIELLNQNYLIQLEIV